MRIVLVLQGGGALGAYQAGVFQALHEHGLAPDWIVGTSIGAINGAILAGNPHETRLARLRQSDGVVHRAMKQRIGVQRVGDQRLRVHDLDAIQLAFTDQPLFVSGECRAFRVFRHMRSSYNSMSRSDFSSAMVAGMPSLPLRIKPRAYTIRPIASSRNTPVRMGRIVQPSVSHAR